MRALDEMLAAITSGLCAAVDWVDLAGVTVVYDSGVETLGATDPDVYKAQAAQDELCEGPSTLVTAARPLLLCEDVASDPRWPRYACVAADLGIGAEAAAWAGTGSSPPAVLSLYSRSPRPLDAAAAELAAMFAVQAATAIGCSTRVDSLTTAVDSRNVIAQAIGIAMERYGLGEARAFDYLVRVSQTNQLKLRVVAQELVTATNSSAKAQMRAPVPGPHGAQE
jgi:ANTAR domain